MSKGLAASTGRFIAHVIRRLVIGAYRCGFRVAGTLAPGPTSRWALRVFTTPVRFKSPEREKSYRASCTLQSIDIGPHRIQTYSWGEDNAPCVLLVHGWCGRGLHVASLAAPLVEAGMRVVSFDGPAHGESTGKRTNMLEFSDTVAALAQRFETQHIIAHSFGGACSLAVIERNHLELISLVLISCPSDVNWIASSFAEHLSIPHKVITHMIDRIEAMFDYTIRWSDIDFVRMIRGIKFPVLIFHDEEDRTLPYEHAVRLHDAAPGSTLVASRGLGHRRILHDDKTKNHIIDFIDAHKLNSGN